MSTITTDATNATTTTINNTYPNNSPTADLHTADSHAAGTHAYDDRKNDSPNTAHHSLWALAATLRRDYTWVDLTHTFFPGQPKFHLLPDEERETVFTVAGTGFHVDRYSLVGQWGTHVDPPIHSAEGARTLDNIPVSESILPLAVLDLHPEAAQNPDLQASVDHVLEWEKRNGRIPPESFVALRTDWSQRWDNNTLENFDADGERHYPGWTVDAIRFLREERDVLAIGHETTDTDSGRSIDGGDFGSELWWLQQDRWQIELLDNLAEVPETGALIVATWAKPKDGTGFPARVFAVVPRTTEPVPRTTEPVPQG